MIHLNPNVGVAPGTTTMQLGCHACTTPNEPWMYTQPPNVVTGYPSGMDAASWTAAMGQAKAASQAPTAPAMYGMNPYASDSKLKGLGDDGQPIRWGLIIFSGAAVFAAVFGYKLIRHRR